MPLNLRDDFENGNVITVHGILDRTLTNKGLTQIVLKVTEVEKLKDLAVSEDEIKRTELRRIKSEKGFKNVDNILKTSCSQDYIHKKKPEWSNLQRLVWWLSAHGKGNLYNRPIHSPTLSDRQFSGFQMVKDVTTQQDTIKIHLSAQNDDDEKVAEVIESFNDLVDELLSMGIEFTYDFKADHDRLIKTDTGWTITLGRGLDIYEKFNRFSLCRSNQTNRRCKAFSVSINKTED